MDALDVFTGEFTTRTVPHRTVKGSCYLDAPLLAVDAPLLYTSVLLGRLRMDSFKPSLPLLDLLGPLTERKAVVNDKAAWLFICGKNILKEGIVSLSHKQGHVLVCNTRDEVLGYGKVTGAGITNKLDRGDFLRRKR